MKLSLRKRRITATDYLATLCASATLQAKAADDLESLVEIVRLLRPRKPKKIQDVDISVFLDFLESNADCRQQLSQYVQGIFYHKKFNKFISDAGILQDSNFVFELRKRIISRLLPIQPQKDRLEYVLNQVFYLATDIVWISKIPSQQLEKLFDLLAFNSFYSSVDKDSPLSELLIAMNLIAQRISGRALETDVIKMVPEYDELESPFSSYEVELLQIEEKIRTSETHYLTPEDLSYRHLFVLHKQCEDFVDRAFSNSSKYGISLRVNQNLLRIRQQLERLKVLFPLLVVETQTFEKKNTIMMALQLIRYNCFKNNVRKFISESTQLISYEITQHTAKTGEHYITVGRGEYFKMLRTALGGGLIVGILCIIKVLLSMVDTSYFGHAFLYSMNYALGFIAIYLLGFTLATKQPAMTASLLVRALEEGYKKQGRKSEKYVDFAILFARVFRSQFIAFVGNVIMAFPVSLLGIYTLQQIFHTNFAEAKWNTLLTDLSPIHSMAIFHAAIAGVFLFLSGIISGSVANRDKHNQVYYRIQEHPLLKKKLGRKNTDKIAGIYERRWAGIISNFWFGVFMGSTAIIGLFLGLNLDIRHITFASGNLALGLYGAGFVVDKMLLFWGIFGIGMIGLVNFMVSFGLSMVLAFRSRNISFFEVRYVVTSVWKHFKSRPLSFFFPTEKKVKPIVEENLVVQE